MLDGSIDDSSIFDQIALLKGDMRPYNSMLNKVANTVKLIFETTNLNHVPPSILNQTLLIVQTPLAWKCVLESKIHILSLKFMLPQSRYVKFIV